MRWNEIILAELLGKIRCSESQKGTAQLREGKKNEYCQSVNLEIILRQFERLKQPSCI